MFDKINKTDKIKYFLIQMLEQISIGIDLGNTYSCISWINENNIVEVIPNEYGEKFIPNYVLLNCFFF